MYLFYCWIEFVLFELKKGLCSIQVIGMEEIDGEDAQMILFWISEYGSFINFISHFTLFFLKWVRTSWWIRKGTNLDCGFYSSASLDSFSLESGSFIQVWEERIVIMHRCWSIYCDLLTRTSWWALLHQPIPVPLDQRLLLCPSAHQQSIGLWNCGLLCLLKTPPNHQDSVS